VLFQGLYMLWSGRTFGQNYWGGQLYWPFLLLVGVMMVVAGAFGRWSTRSASVARSAKRSKKSRPSPLESLRKPWT